MQETEFAIVVGEVPATEKQSDLARLSFGPFKESRVVWAMRQVSDFFEKFRPDVVLPSGRICALARRNVTVVSLEDGQKWRLRKQ